MTFKDSMLYFAVVSPIKKWAGMSPYYFILGLPAVAVILVIGLVAALVIDVLCAFREVWEAMQ